MMGPSGRSRVGVARGLRGLVGVLFAVVCFVGLAAVGFEGQALGAADTQRGEVLSLTDVACASPNACTAVGGVTSNPNTPMAERWNGRSWSLQNMPVPASGSTGDQLIPVYGVLSSVSCPSPNTCFAVGTLDINNPFPEPLVQR